MHRIGMLDSPCVRRVAISLRILGIPFECRARSVSRDFGAEAETLAEFVATPLPAAFASPKE